MYTPFEAIAAGFRGYFTTHDFASRSEYWWFAAFYYLLVWAPLIVVGWVGEAFTDAVLSLQPVPGASGDVDAGTVTFESLPSTTIWIIVGCLAVSTVSWLTLRIPLFTVSVRRVADAGGWTGWPWMKLATSIALLMPVFLVFVLVASVYLSGGDLMTAVMNPNFLTTITVWILQIVSSPLISIPATLMLLVATLVTFVYTLLPSRYV